MESCGVSRYEARATHTSLYIQTMSGSCDTWDKCIRLISSDRALLDVLVRGARRRYEFIRSSVQSDTSRIMDNEEKAACWSEAVREVRFYYRISMDMDNVAVMSVYLRRHELV